MTSIAVWTTCLIPYMCRTLMGIPMINLSINAAFSVALIGVDVISLTLYLRGTHAGCNRLFAFEGVGVLGGVGRVVAG